MRVQPHPGTGIEITDVDVRTADDETFDRIRSLFDAHGLVFLRDQNLDEEDHIALARRFGTINVNRFFIDHGDHPEIALVVKEAGQKRNVGGGWHTDHSYDEEPALGSILVARELPARGGDTWFLSMYDAFESLPAPLKRRLRGMRAVHSSKHVFGTRFGRIKKLLGVEELSKSPELADEMEDAIHPVVIRHPLSGREALYINPGFTIRFEGRRLLTSLPLMLVVYAHVLRHAAIAKFHWEPGSIAIWDNRATWHYARNDYDQRREMHRITIDGCAIEASSVAVLDTAATPS
jgi:alpha-ketoglutarate-dependent taurine dioxygenase